MVTGVISITTALVATFATIRISESDVRSDYVNSANIEILKARIQSYPELFTVTLELSVKRPVELTGEEALALGRRVNRWLYGAGGLFASYHSRRAAANLRNTLLDWNSADDSLEAVRKSRDELIFILRADLSLEGDLSVDSHRHLTTDIQRQLELLHRVNEDAGDN